MNHQRPTSNLTFEYEKIIDFKKKFVYVWYIKGNRSSEFMNLSV